SMLRRAMGISLDEKVEDEPMDEENQIKVDINENENVFDDDNDDIDSKTTVYEHCIYAFFLNLCHFFIFKNQIKDVVAFKKRNFNE
ncbi:unnamed protein product, partial [Rotaria socialis]